jgi:hypothetical protein
MANKQSTRRNFLQLLGLSASATLVSTTALAGIIDTTEIKKLNPKQQAFMIGYAKWMDAFIKVIRIKKTDPDNKENNKKLIALTEKAEKFKPELSEYMKDETFRLIYQASIERMSKEI